MAYVWTQRWHGRDKPAYQPMEILSAPSVYLFITAHKAFIHGIVNKGLLYDANTPGVIAGVKFKPGGFYAFFKRPVSELTGRTFPLEPVFAAADTRFTSELLTLPDEAIFTSLEELLHSNRPSADKNLVLVTDIMTALLQDETLQTVRAVARAFGKSERSIQLLFQTYVGVGLKWVITRKRLLETVQQVSSRTRSNWVEAAAEVGYSSQSHFAREFKRIIGRSPSQYLKTITPAP